MSEAIAQFIHELSKDDDSLSEANDCRNSTIKLKHLLEEKFPKAKVDFLAYPEARIGIGVHYSILVGSGDEQFIINLVRAPGFPVYIGPLDQAVPIFREMKKVTSVC